MVQGILGGNYNITYNLILILGVSDKKNKVH